MLTLIRPGQYRSMPWKNGGGITIEIAVSPPGAGMADFAWRVSIAEVAADGPFSSFPGVDRWIALLGGAGMRLESDRFGSREVAAVAQPFAFDGDADVACRLIDGPVRDFNLMARRDRIRSRLLTIDAPVTVEVDRGEFLAFGARGLSRVVSPAGDALELPVGHAVAGVFAPGAPLRILPESQGASVLCALMEPA